jgi:outer membrane protein TolC
VPIDGFRRAAAVAALCVTAAVPALHAQPPAATQPTPDALTLEQAIQYATEHYPAIKASLEQVNASAAGVDVARASYLPRVDGLLQWNRATANNVFGQLLPQSVIPAMSGPALASASADAVWGSAMGALFSWEPFDFGLRKAGVESAEAALARARTGDALTRLDVQNAVAASYLAVLAAGRAVTAARVDLDRRDVLLQSVGSLVANQLRPGADQSRAEAERAAARTRFIQAQQTLTLARTTLARVLGSPAAVAIAGDALLSRVPSGDIAPAAASLHPFAQVHQAGVEQARAEVDVLAKTDQPRLLLQSSVFARGTAADPSGVLNGGADGLGPERANWAAGVQIQFPNVFDFSSLKARRAAAAAASRASAARYEEAVLTVTAEQQAAASVLQSARAIAANTPIQLAAAQQSETQARARYNAGLATVLEVADAQTLLAQAEVQDELARVAVWRALLAAAAADGDLAPFLALLRQP